MILRRHLLRTSSSLLGTMLPAALSLLLTLSAVGGEAKAPVPLTPSDTERTFDFQTPLIEGSIRLDGDYHGVTRLVDKRTGRQVIDPRYSALNLFRLFSTNQGMGQPRKMERTLQIEPHWVQATWPASEAHHGEITARYEVSAPNAIDLTVTVRSAGTYSDYEVFLSSYFDKVLCPHVYLEPQRRAKGVKVPELVVPMVNDVFRGTVLVFARDAHAARRCVDGRWSRNEWKAPTVQMCPVRHYGRCLAFVTDPEKQLGVVLMAHPRHCYAISTRYFADEDADRLTTYSAFDFSLFGDDLLPNDERTVVVRLVLTELDQEMSQPLALYQAFLADVQRCFDLP